MINGHNIIVITLIAALVQDGQADVAEELLQETAIDYGNNGPWLLEEVDDEDMVEYNDPWETGFYDTRTGTFWPDDDTFDIY